MVVQKDMGRSVAIMVQAKQNTGRGKGKRVLARAGGGFGKGAKWRELQLVPGPFLQASARGKTYKGRVMRSIDYGREAAVKTQR